jgi:hypothetical protein
MIVPINADTLMVVRVGNSIQTIPVSAPGSAVAHDDWRSGIADRSKITQELRFSAVRSGDRGPIDISGRIDQEPCIQNLANDVRRLHEERVIRIFSDQFLAGFF